MIGKEKVQEFFHNIEDLESTLLDTPMNNHQLLFYIDRLQTYIENLMEETFREENQNLKPLYAMLELRARNLLKQIKRKLVINN
jgi:hypothetical protein